MMDSEILLRNLVNKKRDFQALKYLKFFILTLTMLMKEGICKNREFSALKIEQKKKTPTHSDVKVEKNMVEFNAVRSIAFM
jgi:hypothetical protein